MTSPAKPATAAEFQSLPLQERARFPPRMLKAVAYMTDSQKGVAFNAVAVLAQAIGSICAGFALHRIGSGNPVGDQARQQSGIAEAT